VGHAVGLRRFINDMIADLPSRIADEICGHVRSDPTDRTIFELMVSRFLRVRGASEVDAPHRTERDRRVDWRAVFDDGILHVEATVPNYDPDSTDLIRRRARLLNVIEDRMPSGWTAIVRRVPNIGDDERLGPFKNLVRDLYNQLPDPARVPPDGIYLLSGSLDQGPLRLGMLPKQYPGRRIGAGPAYAVYPDAELRISAVWDDDRKRQQGRSAPPPAVLAIRGTWGTDLNAFANGLLGRDLSSGPMATDRNPPWASVVAFREFWHAGAKYDPVFLPSPYYNGPIPGAIARLETYQAVGGRLEMVPATDSNVLAGFSFAKDVDEEEPPRA
jgi:hypothetical protein